MIVCMCVVVLKPLGKEDESQGWRACKAMLGDFNLLSALRNFKKDEMTSQQIEKVKDLLGKEKHLFEGDNMKKVSKAGYGLLCWVKAMVQYYDAMVEVQQKQRSAEENLKGRREAADA